MVIVAAHNEAAKAEDERLDALDVDDNAAAVVGDVALGGLANILWAMLFRCAGANFSCGRLDDAVCAWLA